MTDRVGAIEKLFETLIYPNASTMNGDVFRKLHCYQVKTNELLEKNEKVLKQLFTSFCHSKKQYIRCEEAKAYVRKLGLHISEIFVGAIYAESM